MKLDLTGQRGAFYLSEANKDKDGYNTELWGYNSSDDRFEKIQELKGKQNFSWMDDGRLMIQTWSKEEGSIFTAHDLNGGKEEIFKIERKVNSIEKIGDGLYVFTSTYNVEEDNKEEKIGDYVTVDEIPFWNNGSGYTNKNRNRLYIFNQKENKVYPVTNQYTNVMEFNVFADKIIYISQKYVDKQGVENQLFVYNVHEGDTKEISFGKKFLFSYAAFLNEKEIILCGSFMENYGDNENHKIFLMNADGSEMKCLSEDLKYSLWNTVGSDCRYGGGPTMKLFEDKLYFMTSEEGHSFLNSVDRDGNIDKVLHERGSVDSYDISGGNIVFIGMRGSKLQEVYRREDGHEVQKSTFNQWVQEERMIADLELISAESDPGVTVDGWVMKPIGFKDGEKYPAILNIHGGPKSAFGEVFFHEMQYWAARGYVVFFCNLRGSNTRDDQYADIRGKWGIDDYKDIMSFTDKVLEECPYIDQERIGVTGGSYGGYMTNWIIGHTDRFKAAVSQRCISNWISKFNTTDIGYYWTYNQNGATPWTDVQKLWDHSPIKYADKVKTPTLFIHADEDYRCYFAEGVQMFTALKYHNVESKLCIFKGENHELSRSGKPSNRIARLHEITQWFDNHLFIIS